MRQEIPLQGGAVNAHQEFDIQLGNNFVTFNLDYRTLLQQWSLSISSDGVRIVDGLILESDQNVLANFSELNYLGKLWFVGLRPTLNNLGRENFLIWEPPVE